MQVVLATSAVAETKRLQFWREVRGLRYLRRAGLPCGFRGAVFRRDHHRAMRRNAFLARWFRGQIVDRTKSRIRNAREEIVLVSVQTRGRGVVVQDGRQAVLEPGDFACYDSTRPYTLSFDAQFEQIVLHLPRKAMVRRIGATEAVAGNAGRCGEPARLACGPVHPQHGGDRLGGRRDHRWQAIGRLPLDS